MNGLKLFTFQRRKLLTIWATALLGLQLIVFPALRAQGSDDDPCASRLENQGAIDMVSWVENATDAFLQRLGVLHGVFQDLSEVVDRALLASRDESLSVVRVGATTGALRQELIHLLEGIKPLPRRGRPQSSKGVMSKMDLTLHHFGRATPPFFDWLRESRLAREHVVDLFVGEFGEDVDLEYRDEVADHLRHSLDFWLASGEWQFSHDSVFAEWLEVQLALKGAKLQNFLRGFFTKVIHLYQERGGDIGAWDLDGVYRDVLRFVKSQVIHEGVVGPFLTGFVLATVTDFQPRSATSMKTAMLHQLTSGKPKVKRPPPLQPGILRASLASPARPQTLEPAEQTPSPVVQVPASQPRYRGGNPAKTPSVVIPRGVGVQIRELNRSTGERWKLFLAQAQEGPQSLERFLRQQQGSWQLRKIIYYRQEMYVARLSGGFVVGFKMDPASGMVEIVEVSKTFGRDGQSR